MKTLFRLVVFILLLAGWSLAALSLHVVRAAGDHIVLIPKQRLSIDDTYVDARTWKIDDVANHASLFERVIQSGKADSFAYVVGDPKGDVERQLEDAVRSAPTTRPDDIHRLVKSAMNHARSRTANAASASTGTSWWDFGK